MTQLYLLGTDLNYAQRKTRLYTCIYMLLCEVEADVQVAGAVRHMREGSAKWTD